MTSRERVLAAITHNTPDKVPVDLGATPSSGISAISYAKLLSHLNIDGKVWIYDVVQQLAQPEERIIDLFGVDILDIGRAYNTQTADWYPVTMANGSIGYYPNWFKPELLDNGSWIAKHNDGTTIAVMPDGATFFDQNYFPWGDGYPDSRADMAAGLDAAMDKVLWQKFVHSPWDHAENDDFWKDLRVRTLKLRETTDKALLIACGSNLLEWGTFLRRMDNFLMDLYIDQDSVRLLVELLMERHMKTIEKVCESVGDLVDVIRFGDDLGMDSGPFMGLEIYRELFHDARTQMCSYVHEHSSMHTFIHACGSIEQYIPSLIESGIEIINPVQTNCLNMEPNHLKKEFGKDIVFWGGGVDPREILNRGTPMQVREDVLNRMEIFAADGGFIFNNIHNILPDVPAENIVALFEAVKEFNRR
jgi:uroporphyrinogen decarboxylase